LAADSDAEHPPLDLDHLLREPAIMVRALEPPCDAVSVMLIGTPVLAGELR